ncbi:cold shock domain-containing protein [Parahaliea mediterranea]|uniref:cold shock domain-containing protein n=1 Tax=Parahaliea mediterranea TaxID=651086 RepID=UPI001F4D4808|nr:cold shock domain-containing protein [Parahaliea mediterranea]
MASNVPAGAPRETGSVKWFNVSKGFGFIIREDGEEIFVHFRSIRGDGRRSLRDGQRVDFVVGSSAKGPQAEDVVALD